MDEFHKVVLATFIGGVLVLDFVATASILSDFIIRAALYPIQDHLRQHYEDRWERLKKIPGNSWKIPFSVGCLLFVWGAFIYLIATEALLVLGPAVRDALRVSAEIRAARYGITSIKIARCLNQLGNKLSQMS